MQARPWRLLLLAAPIALAMMLVTSCADDAPNRNVASISGTNGPRSSQAPDPGSGEDRFAKCMKDNGAELGGTEIPNDGSGSGEAKQTASPQVDQRRQQEAFEKCRQFLPDGGNPKPMSPEALEQARKFAKCMRAEGVDYPDPDPNASGGDGVMPIPEGVDIRDPKVQAKFDKCSHEFGGEPGAGGPTR